MKIEENVDFFLKYCCLNGNYFVYKRKTNVIYYYYPFMCLWLLLYWIGMNMNDIAFWTFPWKEKQRRVQRRIANLVGHDLASSLSLCSLIEPLLQILYGRCYKGLSLVVPPNRIFGRTTRFSAHSHHHTVSVPKANTRCGTHPVSSHVLPFFGIHYL